MTQETIENQIVEALKNQTVILNQISIILERLINIFYPTATEEEHIKRPEDEGGNHNDD